MSTGQRSTLITRLFALCVLGLAAVAGAALGAPQARAAEPPAAEVAPPPVATTTKVTPDPSNIGDVLEYEVIAAFPRGVSVNLPSGLSFEPLHLVSVSESEPEVTGAGLRKTFTLRLQHFDVGEAQIPGFDLTYVSHDGEVQTIAVPAKPFVVEALLANESEAERKPEDPPVSIEYPNDRAELIIYAAAGALLLAACVIPIVLLIMWRKKPEFLPPPIPPHEVAYEALQELENGDLLEQERHADFYVQLTEIAKGYLQGRFGVRALDRTTDEIGLELSLHVDRVAPLSADAIVRFLQECDLVKFARFRPASEEAADAVGVVRTMVDRTSLAAAQPNESTPAEDDTSSPSADNDASANDNEEEEAT